MCVYVCMYSMSMSYTITMSVYIYIHKLYYWLLPTISCYSRWEVSALSQGDRQGDPRALGRAARAWAGERGWDS